MPVHLPYSTNDSSRGLSSETLGSASRTSGTLGQSDLELRVGSLGLGVGINSLGLKNPTSPFLLPSVPRAAIMQPNAPGS